MIVPMKKVAVCVKAKDAEQAARALAEMGVLHVEHQQAPAGKDIASLRDDIALLDSVIGILSAPELRSKCGIRDIKLLPDWRFAAKHTIDSYARIDQLAEYAITLAATIAEWAPWGDFDPVSIRALADRGIYTRLYQVPLHELDAIPAGTTVRTIAAVTGIAYCAVISGEDTPLPFKEIQPPKMGLQEMRARLAENENIITALRDTIRKYTCYTERFLQIRAAFNRELEFHEALRGMGESAGIAYIIGYIPIDAATALSGKAKKESWGVLITDPAEGDIVPTLVRNPRWVSVINPVFKMLDIVPGYKELDISFWFLLFFSIFFGMLIGDAGVGGVFFLLTAFAHLKRGARMRDRSIIYLMYVLSLCAVGWGLLSGTIFGQAWLPPSFRPLVPALRDNRNIQELCFFLGAIQLSIAHLWRATLKAPSVTALADIGWTSILWGGFFLARLLVLGESFPPFAKWFFIAGAALVAVCTNPSRNVLRGLGEGLGSLALNLVNSFTDLVSYIRLFAVGLASVAIADAFNRMAADIGFNSVVTVLLAGLILVLGHALNILLGPLAVLVHGVRLNVLEFCGHLDVKWSGHAYKPLGDESPAGGPSRRS